jgi:hypothetical protein
LSEDIDNQNIDFFDKQFFRNYLKEIKWDETQINIPKEIKKYYYFKV